MRYKKLKHGELYVPGWEWRYVTAKSKSKWIKGVGCVDQKYNSANVNVEVRIPTELQAV